NAFRSLDSSLQLYSNDTPDSQGAAGALDSASLSGASYSGTLQSHITTLITAQADFLVSKLIDANGAVANSYHLVAGTTDGRAALLESEAGAGRGLPEAYLATSQQKYRDSAMTVYADLQQRFWMDDVRCFRTTAGVDDPMDYT